MWVNQMEDVLTLTLTLTVLPHCHSLITYSLPYSGGVMWVNQMEDVLTLTLTLTVLPHCHSLPLTYSLTPLLRGRDVGEPDGGRRKSSLDPASQHVALPVCSE